jgi:hypothetical protein
MRYTPPMKDTDKRVRRSAFHMIALSMALGFLIGFVVGAVVMYRSIDQTVVMPLTEGVKI